MGFAKTARVEHKVINPRHLVDVTIGAHIGVRIGTICWGAKLLESVSNLKSTIADTINHRIMVGGGEQLRILRSPIPLLVLTWD